MEDKNVNQKQETSRWNENCTQCGAPNPQNYSYTICKSCLQKGKEAGWYDENW